METESLQVNEYITKFSDIKPKLDELLENLSLQEILILNHGCSNKIIDKMVSYIKDHDVIAIVESKGASTLNRMYGV